MIYMDVRGGGGVGWGGNDDWSWEQVLRCGLVEGGLLFHLVNWAGP